MAQEQQPDLKLTPLACRLQSSRSIHCAKRLLRETGDCISFAMPSVEPVIIAMAAFNRELPIQHNHLSNREIKGSDLDQLGRNAARGVAHGLIAVGRVRPWGCRTDG